MLLLSLINMPRLNQKLLQKHFLIICFLLHNTESLVLPHFFLLYQIVNELWLYQNKIHSINALSSNTSYHATLVYGGAEEDRTPDPLRARQVLSQLSYDPFFAAIFCFTLRYQCSFAQSRTDVRFFAHSHRCLD